MRRAPPPFPRRRRVRLTAGRVGACALDSRARADDTTRMCYAVG